LTQIYNIIIAFENKIIIPKPSGSFSPIYGHSYTKINSGSTETYIYSNSIISGSFISESLMSGSIKDSIISGSLTGSFDLSCSIQSESILDGQFPHFYFSGSYIVPPNTEPIFHVGEMSENNVIIIEQSEAVGIFSGSMAGVITGSIEFSGTIISNSYFSGTFDSRSYFKGNIDSGVVFTGSGYKIPYTSSNVIEVHSHYCPTLAGLTFDSCSQLKVYDVIGNENFISMSLEGCTSLEEFTMSNNISLSYINLKNTNLSNDVLDSILPQFYTQSKESTTKAYLNIEGTDLDTIGTQGKAAIQGLRNLGWTIDS